MLQYRWVLQIYRIFSRPLVQRTPFHASVRVSIGNTLRLNIVRQPVKREEGRIATALSSLTEHIYAMP